MSNQQLIVFDFDWSMADQDTDRWILEVLAPDLRRKMVQLKEEIQWTDLVAQSLVEAHARGITKEQIIHTLQIMPYHPAMVRAVTNLKAGGKTTFLCLSNANSVFISTILESKGLETLFQEIITNPADWEPSGLLKLRRRVDPAGQQHSCKVGCSEELDAFLKRQGVEYDRIVYIGDGGNDFCPILRLRSQDLVFCRLHRGLQRRIEHDTEAKALKPSVRYWGGAWEIEEMFSKL
ncbi:hypothetical protein BYT27DRAFT_7220167 [Phlegmacium glaucopus]|nr:hypothetical protein BYT27DRAFT_7220167 [Phlegmacium glaucopus]